MSGVLHLTMLDSQLDQCTKLHFVRLQWPWALMNCFSIHPSKPPSSDDWVWEYAVLRLLNIFAANHSPEEAENHQWWKGYAWLWKGQLWLVDHLIRNLVFLDNIYKTDGSCSYLDHYVSLSPLVTVSSLDVYALWKSLVWQSLFRTQIEAYCSHVFCRSFAGKTLTSRWIN